MFLTWVIVSVYSTFISKTKQLGIQNCNWWFERILIHFSMHYSTPKENILVFFLLCNVAENFELLSNKNATPQFFLWDLFSFLKQIAHFQSFLSFSSSLSLSPGTCNLLPLYDNALALCIFGNKHQLQASHIFSCVQNNLWLIVASRITINSVLF